MRAHALFLSLLPLVPFVTSRSTASTSDILPANFQPPQVWVNANQVRTINLEKSYPREAINTVIENVSDDPQTEYYLPFAGDVIANVGGLQVKDKKDPLKEGFSAELVELDSESSTQYYRLTLPPVAPKSSLTLSITYTLLSTLSPLPAKIPQASPQHLTYSLSAYIPSAYPTTKQRTRLRFPSTRVPDFTTVPRPATADTPEALDPDRQGPTFTYGPYPPLPAGAAHPITVRYEFTKPIPSVSLLERDLEVSHWGGNLATEERYWLENHAAALREQFSRLEYQKEGYSTTAQSSALKEVRRPLAPGAGNPYFTDAIGNISTSRFRPGDVVAKRDASWELKPRFPVYGGWKYAFKIGWDADLSAYIRRIASGSDHFVLKVPFLEGLKLDEGLQYKRAVVRVILPEGARDINFATAVPLANDEITIHKTFMDTLGRPTLQLTAVNIVDEWRDKDLIVTYTYPWTAGYRKPLTIAAAMISVFITVWIVGSLDVSIGRKTK
ncbi:oligosaccharyltransferase alpha subunit [Eremomyces bilateralis CBS 781.70]|uniref:Dolichyl-diphosphooligosaccharide--protein glycosyltransferase subunit 1 n=1 Tax=Eremomyces bilateralis CBS 781.70 TaxID=1392243 RepID=A0A6G1FUP1_9PEZI|nr:oligosaccharyltransferase alpha subunit [Eremomyces bilateralis CBS 781.70]KAF1809426.1 oligosaccharyltransferase alpha subunit [Eremomyces bilateralis CBS 781.70]